MFDYFVDRLTVWSVCVCLSIRLNRMHYKRRRDWESYREREKDRAREHGSAMDATGNTHRQEKH